MRPSLTILAVLPLAVVGDDALCARSGLLVDVVNEEWTPNGRPDGPRKARPWAYTTSDTYSGAWLQTVERFVEAVEPWRLKNMGSIEGAVWADVMAQRRTRADLRTRTAMTRDFYDFAVEHWSYLWKLSADAGFLRNVASRLLRYRDDLRARRVNARRVIPASLVMIPFGGMLGASDVQRRLGMASLGAVVASLTRTFARVVVTVCDAEHVAVAALALDRSGPRAHVARIPGNQKYGVRGRTRLDAARRRPRRLRAARATARDPDRDAEVPTRGPAEPAARRRRALRRAPRGRLGLLPVIFFSGVPPRARADAALPGTFAGVLSSSSLISLRLPLFGRIL